MSNMAKGKTLQLGVADMWAWTFRENEARSRAPLTRRKQPLTDVQIEALMRAEFPDRESEVFTRVQDVRTRYNRGELTGMVPPALPSRPYDDVGQPFKPRRGRPPKCPQPDGESIESPGQTDVPPRETDGLSVEGGPS